MGIPGLLQFIKDAAEPVNVKKYRGQTVAVDTYCWLHKGAFSCAEKLAKGEETDQYVWYCMKFVDMLLNFRVKPILVFDGRNLPSKQEVEKSRRERREANLQKGRRLLREGKVSEARDCFTRCVNITPPMAHKLIKAARARGVDCVVAPYEADAQLAYLNKSGLAQAVITEDSDLLAFGCRKVILKMDKQGNGLEIDQSNLGRCRSLGNVFTEEKFRHMCILSGCDYLSSLHGIGLGKACKLLKLAKDPDILKVIRKMGQYLKMNLIVPESYVEGFIRADNTFLYQLVFDPVLKKVVPLNPYPDHLDTDALPYAGLNLGDAVGFQMALGNLDINTLQRIDDFNPDKPHPKTGKARSHSWSDSPLSTGPSVWTKGLSWSCADVPQPAAPAHTSLPSRGQQRVTSLLQERRACKELQVKRPRQDSAVVEQELLQQYSSTTSPKRSRAERPVATPTLKSQARPRNHFATLLQRRNQEEEEEGHATRSRFFSQSSSSIVCQSASGQPVELTAGGAAPSSPPTKSQDSDEPEVPSVDTPSPPPPPSPGLRLFHWSDGSSPSVHPAAATCAGLAALRRFQYKTPSVLSPESSPPLTKLQVNSLSCPAEEAPISSSPRTFTNHNHETKGEDRTSLSHGARGERPVGSKSGSLSRVQRLGPARVSGLRKRPSSSNNENNPGVQATISSLWKNFSFNKVNTKMTSCQKAELVSPVKDGVTAR